MSKKSTLFTQRSLCSSLLKSLHHPSVNKQGKMKLLICSQTRYSVSRPTENRLALPYTSCNALIRNAGPNSIISF